MKNKITTTTTITTKEQLYIKNSYFNMAEAHTCITEERLKILIKSIFAEEFQKQEKNIRGSFEITMKEIKRLQGRSQ